VDPLNLQPVVARNRTRYGNAAADYERFRADALAALVARANLTGDNGAALPAVTGTTDTLVAASGDQITDDAGAWNAWWDYMPGVYGTRATGIGAAGQAQFKDARAKRAARSVTRPATGGSSGPYAPTGPYIDPYQQAYEDSLAAIRRTGTAPTYDPNRPATRPVAPGRRPRHADGLAHW
jgi:hypothetical protein